jgi:exopolyphosphatase
MAVPRTSLRNFLVQAKSTLRTAISQGQKVTLVIGNESAGINTSQRFHIISDNTNLDLDSFTSSILFAYIRSSFPPQKAFTPLYIPVTNIPAADIQLRPELLALLPHANIEQHHLITLDDLPRAEDSSLDPENTRWILVDHNALQGAIGQRYSHRVAGAIDHHDDESKVPKDTGSEPRIIIKTGSCTSLVTTYTREAWDTLSSAAQISGAANAQSDSDIVVNDAAFASLWDAQVAKLALASVLIDTTNLQSDDKVTKQDLEAVRILESKIASSPQGSKNFNRDQFFQEISKAKRDIGGLKLPDILRKDYKEWTEGCQKLGISSVVKQVDFLITKARDENPESSSAEEAFLSSLKKFASDRKLDIMAIMTTSTSATGEFQRELLVWALNSASSPIAAKFEQQAKQELSLAPWQGSVKDIDHEGQDVWRKIWKQNAVQHSRKRVAPLLRKAMN